jgi:hypothetical protein
MKKLSRTCAYVLITTLLSLGAPAASFNPSKSATISVSAFVTDPVGLLQVDSSDEHASFLGLRLPLSGEYIAKSSSGATISLHFDTRRVVPLYSLPAPGDTITVICTDN